jgi:pyridoxamine 5'-phosphate oxidase
VDLARMRREYEEAGIEAGAFAPDPLAQFALWLREAIEADLEEPNAMVLATVDGHGQPWTRHVLLKGTTADGFDFYTNYESDKSTQLSARPLASLCFGWLGLSRQVIATGGVARVTDAESDAYWALRPRGSQLGSLASSQSRPLTSRQELLDRSAELDRAHPTVVPRPPHWGGWRLVPHTVEFWQGRSNRLHDRLRYTGHSAAWTLTRLSP